MLPDLVTFARRGNRAANQWLGEHPAVLGGIFLVLGVAILGWGIYEMRSGVAHTKYGKQVSGGTATALAVIRIVAGAGCLLFGLYKLIAG